MMVWGWLVCQFGPSAKEERAAVLFIFFTPAVLSPFQCAHSVAAHKLLPDGCIRTSAEILYCVRLTDFGRSFPHAPMGHGYHVHHVRATRLTFMAASNS